MQPFISFKSKKNNNYNLRHVQLLQHLPLRSKKHLMLSASAHLVEKHPSPPADIFKWLLWSQHILTPFMLWLRLLFFHVILDKFKGFVCIIGVIFERVWLQFLLH